MSKLEEKFEEIILGQLETLEDKPLKEQSEIVENVRKMTVVKTEIQKADIEYDVKVSQMESDKDRLEIEKQKEIREQALYELQIEEKRKEKTWKVIKTILEVLALGTPIAIEGVKLHEYRKTRDAYMTAEYGGEPYGCITSKGMTNCLNSGMKDLNRL